MQQTSGKSCLHWIMRMEDSGSKISRGKKREWERDRNRGKERERDK